MAAAGAAALLHRLFLWLWLRLRLVDGGRD
jgi:hypothetical protein